MILRHPARNRLPRDHIRLLRPALPLQSQQTRRKERP